MSAFVRPGGVRPLDLHDLTAPMAGDAPLWSADDVVRLVLTWSVSLAAIVVAWHQADTSTSAADQIGWITLGVGGLAVLAVGNGAWLLRGRREVGRGQRALLAHRLRRPAVTWSDDPTLVTDLGASELVAVDAGTRYHLPACPLVVGKAWRAASLGTHERTGRKPCELCQS